MVFVLVVCTQGVAVINAHRLKDASLQERATLCSTYHDMAPVMCVPAITGTCQMLLPFNAYYTTTYQVHIYKLFSRTLQVSEPKEKNKERS